MNRHSSNSARQAEAILQAWQDGDSWRFQWEVDAVAGLELSISNSVEMERVEVLRGIAGELAGRRRQLEEPSTQIYRELLRHLAFGPAGLASNEGTPAMVC